MPTYEYRAKNLAGEELSGVYDAVSKDALAFMLQEKGYFILSANKQGTQVTLSGFMGKVNSKDLALFSRQFAVLINAGVTIVESVGILREQAEKQKLGDVLEEIHEELQKGRVLSEAMAAYPDIFPDFMMNMIKVGEASGSLDMVLNRLADFYENEARIHRKIKAAMTYPMLLVILTIGVVILLLVKIIPMFSDILSQMGGELPFITKALLSLSGFLTHNFYIIIPAVVVAIAAFSYWSKTENGRVKLDRLKLELPLIKTTTTKTITARFSRSLSILLKSGIPIITSMDIIGDLIGNRVVEEKFRECRDEIKEGKGIAQSLRKIGIFPPLLIHMVSVGEDTGELDEMLSRTAGFFDEEVEEAIEKMTVMIEPLMIIIMAGVVGTVILSLMLPMISVLSAVQ